MDRLNEVQQVAICKLSWYRLAIGLIRMGLDEDEVDIMSKESLREAWAHMVTHGRDTPSEGGSSETISARALRLSEELQPERLPPKKLVYEEREREKERERAERNEREEKEEREREKEMEEKKEKEEGRRKEEDERRRDAEERAERKARESRDEREREETQKREEEERKRREEETMRREEETMRREEEKAKQCNGKFLLKDELLYRRDQIVGHQIEQLCLPESRIGIVLESAHEAPFAGHMAAKTTGDRIRLIFWFPDMEERIQNHCAPCSACQPRAPVKTSHRVPVQSLKENLELTRAYAEHCSDVEQKRMTEYYNLRSMDRKHAVGEKVIVLAPDSKGAKRFNRWQGPGTVVEVKSPYSYIVEIDGRKKHVHANKIRKYNERIQEALVNNCAVIFERDREVGHVAVISADDPEAVRPSQSIEAERIAHLSTVEQSQSLALLDRYPMVFIETPGFYALVEHEIELLPSFVPRRLKAYRIPELLKPEVDRQIKEMLGLDIIEPSTSEVASPTVCVMKGPDGKGGVRLAIDYRHIKFKYRPGKHNLVADFLSRM